MEKRAAQNPSVERIRNSEFIKRLKPKVLEYTGKYDKFIDKVDKKLVEWNKEMSKPRKSIAERGIDALNSWMEKNKKENPETTKQKQNILNAYNKAKKDDTLGIGFGGEPTPEKQETIKQKQNILNAYEKAKKDNTLGEGFGGEPSSKSGRSKIKDMPRPKVMDVGRRIIKY